MEVPQRFELGSLDSESRVLTITRTERNKLKHKWMGPCKIVECHQPTYNVEIQTRKGVKHVRLVWNHSKRARNHSEFVDVDIEDKKGLTVTKDFADTSFDEDENEEMQAEQRR